MVTLAFLVAACLDPVQAALVLALVIACRGFQPILVAGAAGAIVTETVMSLAAPEYVWGELLAPRLVAALLQAAVSVLVIRMVWSAARSAGAAIGVSRLSASDGTSSCGVLQSRPASRRMPLWHLQSYARRRLDGLRQRKMQP